MLLWCLFLACFVVFTYASEESQLCDTPKPGRCKHGLDGTSAICRITDICQLERLVKNGRENLTKLDLSNNELVVVPERSLSNYKALLLLSLAYNNISYLAFGAFCGLDNLKTLNLSGNPFRSFTGQRSGLFPLLETIDATGIKEWKPEKTLLQLRMLKNITGFFWSREPECQLCSLYRLNRTWAPKFTTFSIKGYSCAFSHYKVNLLAPIARYLKNTSFDLKCKRNAVIQEPSGRTALLLEDFYCKHGWQWQEHYKQKLYQYVGRTNSCWEKQLVFVSCMIFLGALTVLSNLIVFTNILSSEVLRENVTMLFVSNLAISDFLVAVYVVCIGIYWNSTPYAEASGNKTKMCPRFGFLWLLGQCNSVSTSLLLTIERYLVLVFTLNPIMRISRRMAVILLVTFWTISLILTSFSLYHNLYKFSLLCVPINFSSDHLNGLASIFTLIIVSIAAMFYFVIFMLYLHIYIDVKRTALNAGARIEAKTAKGIALMVFTILIFFVLPLIASIMVVIYGESDSVLSYFISYSLPGLSVSINSFLNPFLYAYRTQFFSNILKSRLKKCKRMIANFVGINNSVNSIRTSTRKTYDDENADVNIKSKHNNNDDNKNIADNNDGQKNNDNNSAVHNYNSHNSDKGNNNIDSYNDEGDCNIDNNDRTDDNIDNNNDEGDCNIDNDGHDNNIDNNDHGKNNKDNNNDEGDCNIDNNDRADDNNDNNNDEVDCNIDNDGHNNNIDNNDHGNGNNDNNDDEGDCNIDNNDRADDNNDINNDEGDCNIDNNDHGNGNIDNNNDEGDCNIDNNDHGNGNNDNNNDESDCNIDNDGHGNGNNDNNNDEGD